MNILIVDDDVECGNATRRLLARTGACTTKTCPPRGHVVPRYFHEVTLFGNLEEAVYLLERASHAWMLVTDFDLGVEISDELWRRAFAAAKGGVLFYTGSPAAARKRFPDTAIIAKPNTEILVQALNVFTPQRPSFAPKDSVSPWIDVRERVPELGTWGEEKNSDLVVVLRSGDSNPRIGYRNIHGWSEPGVMYWMPIPPAPRDV